MAHTNGICQAALFYAAVLQFSIYRHRCAACHQEQNIMIGIKLAYYRKKDWKRFVKIIADRERMHYTWHDWHKDFEKTKQDLTNLGFDVVDIVVDLDELTEYCRLKGITNDGKARSQFVQEK